MKRFSKNNKLNGVLTGIYNDLLEFGLEEVKRYYNEFKHESDYNIAQYGNMIVYYSDLREFYKNNGYKSLEKMSDQKIWEIYKRQVGCIAYQMVEGVE